jgi:sugar phosphate permease
VNSQTAATNNLAQSAGARVDDRPLYRWVILLIAWAGFLISMADRLIWTNISGLAAASFGLSVAELGAFVTAFYVGYVVSQALTGLMSDYIGPRLMLTLALIPLGVFTFAFGNTTTMTGAIVLQILMGLTAGADLAAGIKLIVSWFTLHDRGRAMGLFMTATSLGVVATNFVVPRLLSVMSWMAIYHVFGIAISIFGVICYLAVRDNPGGVPTKPIAWGEALHLVSNKQWLFVALAGFGGVWGTWGFAIWASALMTRGLHFSPILAGSVVGTFGIVALVGKPAIGLLSDWLGGKKKVLVMIDLLAFAALLLLTGKLTTETEIWIVAPLLGLAAFCYSPLQNAMAAEAAGKASGSGAGLSAAFGSIGTAIVPMVIGIAYQATQSFEVAFAILAAGPFLGGLCMLAARDIKPGKA